MGSRDGALDWGQLTSTWETISGLTKHELAYSIIFDASKSWTGET